MAQLIRNLGGQTEVLTRHGLSQDEFVAALPGAIERIRGSKSAGVADRKAFLTALLQGLVNRGIVSRLQTPRHGSDTVYRLTVQGVGDVAIIQKGCPDGAHSSVRWSVPDWADETYLWWLCDSMKYQPGEHVAKGVNRLRQRFFGDLPDTLDGVIFHNELCGGPERRCPKQGYSVDLGGVIVPPPCVYVMPDRDQGATEWNWDGGTPRRFPALLLSAFGISAAQAPSFIGHVGFQRRGREDHSVIVSRFGPAQVTKYRS
ncbi:hypothetical protein GCM10010387_13760 [Streptomyces inusitatus]|uniref:Uncharacterized protein n=1 Tax=Streptomyces inusitatus TaxID=68221 RepID=A0A918UN05_9ACTN|nr:hypothetical protein [Streptomyces inusitatus]GGZ21881.1 hypothetical protein GCM10010387_13760 [Streptomyces inusitatus]